MSERTPTLAQVFERARARLAEEIHTSIPCKITRYDTAKRLADVQPLIKFRYRTEADEEKAEAFPVVTNCPCLFMGGGKFRMLFDYVIGDTVLVAFSESSIDKWTAQGGTVDPLDTRRHALSDGIVLGTLRPANAPWQGDASAGPSWAHDESGNGIHLRENEILAGSPSASELVALASKVDTALGQLKTALNSWVPVPMDGGLALKTILTTLFATWPASTAGSKLKTE